jgi:hypothetical protein
MNTIMDVGRGVIGLFVDDEFLAIAVLVVITATAFLIVGLGVQPLIAGGVLLVGNVIVLVLGAVLTARRQQRP